MNLLGIDDVSKDQIDEIFQIADDIKKGKSEIKLKEEITAVLLFEEPSTRTRISFETAVDQLGGHGIYIDEMTSQLARGELWADTAKVLSGYADILIVRLFSHDVLLEIAKHATIPVINALTNLEHPTQALTDMYTIKQYKKDLQELKIAYIGDIASNTANSLMLAATKLGVEISLVGPLECLPNSKYLAKAREFGIAKVYNNIEEGVSGADVVYTDSFVSMGEETDAARREKLFAPYQLNASVLENAASDAIVMHCMPAHRGDEITSEVMDGPKSVIFEQARNKQLLAKAIILYLIGVREG